MKTISLGGYTSVLEMEGKEKVLYERVLNTQREMRSKVPHNLSLRYEDSNELGDMVLELVKPFIERIGLHVLDNSQRKPIIPIVKIYEKFMTYEVNCNSFLIYQEEDGLINHFRPTLSFDLRPNFLRAKSKLHNVGSNSMIELLELTTRKGFKEADGIYLPKIKKQHFTLHVASIEKMREVVMMSQALMKVIKFNELKMLHNISKGI